MKRTHKLLSILLTLALLLGMVPMTAMAVEDPKVIVTHDVDKIRELLQQDGDVSIKLGADVEKKLTAYSDFEDDKWNSQYVWTKIGSGNKTIDLNGYRLYVYDQSARSLGSLDLMDFRYIQGALLMEIPEDAALTVNDSRGGGMIWMDAEMPDKSEIEGPNLLMERNIFAVTGGNLTVNGGEIHAGRSKEIYAQSALKHDKDYMPIHDFTEYFYEYLYGYATWFLSGTAITAESGNVTINGGDIWGRGWDNWTLITRVPGAPNGADDFRDRCAALRLLGDSTAHIAGGNFYGRSDADAVQVSNPNNLTVDAGSFDIATNSWLVIPGVEWGGTADNINDIFFHDSVFEVHEGYVGSFGVPDACINDQSVKVVKGNTMTLSKNSIDPYKVIDEVNIHINSPLAYETPTEEVYNVPDGCAVDSVTWYHNGSKVDNPKDTYFVEGDSYYVKIALSVDIAAGTKFKNNLNSISINGKDVELYREDEETIVLTARFGECISTLEALEFSVIEPKQGYTPDYSINSADYELYDAIGGYGNYMDYRKWYVSDDGENEWTEMDAEDTFVAGKCYRFSFEVHTNEGQQFAVDSSGVSVLPNISATVNNSYATVSKTYEQDPSEHVTVICDFGKCLTQIYSVELTVTAPKDSQTISYNVTAGADSYYAIKDGNNNSTYRRWYQSDTGYDGWTEMSPGSAFVAGKYYKFEIDVYCKSGYEFSVYHDGTSIQPNVAACVNNYGAKVSKSYEQDPSRYITVTYFFGLCNDDVVENITITNIDAPVAGQTPDYMANCFGTGYSMANTNSGNWKVNGIVWLRDGNNYTGYTMDNTEKFQAGHEYTVMIDLVADNGYTFLFNHGSSIYAAATINGEVAQINLEGCSTTGYQIWYTFTCTQPTVDTIMLYDVTAPQAGKTPDTEVTSAYPELYVVDSVRWLDEEDGAVNSFEQGRLYTVEITVEAKDYDGVDGCIFANEVTAYIDGTEVTGWTNSVTTNNDNTVTIRYGFRNGASAPEGPSGTTVSGSAVSWNDTDDAVYLLYSNSTADSTIKAEWAAGSYNALYTATKGSITDATVDNKAMKSQTFTFEDVELGVYKLVILKPGKYVPKIVEVTVGGSPVNAGQQKLWLYGDVNYDGSVNNLDILQINRNISSLDSIFDAGTDEDKESRNVAANVTALISGDTEVNNLDVLQINRYISSLDSIFDTMK